MPRLEHPYTDLNGGAWLKGNLHAHTTRSDGRHTPQDLIDAYADRGYGFLAISDHDLHLTPSELAGLDSRGMVLLSANEVTADGPHLLHVHADRTVNSSWMRQRVLDEIADVGGFAVINHPNWQQHFDHWPMSLLLQLTGYAGIEIFNGIMVGEIGSAYATEKWDMLLSAGRRVWGFADDDTHRPEGVALGWNVVYVAQHTAAAILQALRQGRFYASTGVAITSIQVEGMRVRIETQNAQRIVAVSQWATRLATTDTQCLEMLIPDDVPYVRFECWGAGESFAWTQPFLVTND